MNPAGSRGPAESGRPPRQPEPEVRSDPAVDPAGGARKESSPIAPERTPRPGGTSLPGIPSSALVKAGPASADRFPPGGDEPSREEVQQRIASLYDRVESATGNFNATRAMTRVTRGTVTPAVAPAPLPAPAPSSGDRADRGAATGATASSADVARQWFDVGRARLGPLFPAVLPPDRSPDRGAPGARPADSGGRPGSRGRETPDRPVLELTAGPAGSALGPVAELTAGPVAEPAAGPVAALPAVPAQRRATGSTLPGPASAESPQVLQASRAPLRTMKQRNQRKLGRARELLAGHAAGRLAALPAPAPVAAIESRPADSAWRPAGEQTPPRTGAGPWQQPSAGNAPYAEDPLHTGTGAYPLPEMRVAAEPALGSGMYLGADQYTGTGLYIDASTPIAAGVAQDMRGRPGPGHGGQGARAVEFARGQIGKPCVWGAMGPGSYDCSSLTQAAWRTAGVALPRSVHDQATAGTTVPVSDIRPGDLIFFNGPVGHVGICTGDGMMVHAPSPGAAIREESVHRAGESAIHSVVRPA
ncbi:C40 family peptidase [Streptomyces beigongshangae]|uniref:C40 family peptidase n=1 Tax=Streptomyces beigongshangae TaxID=2841597 RepID=UPI0027DECE73|nr:NlpC/P60 family protein [Streptomyces sp. REN17]